MAGMADNADPAQVLFEFRCVGNSVRVAAIDAVSNTEVVIVAPRGCAERDLQRMVMQKLARVRGDALRPPGRLAEKGSQGAL